MRQAPRTLSLSALALVAACGVHERRPLFHPEGDKGSWLRAAGFREGALLDQGGRVSDHASPGAGVVHAGVGAAGSTVTIAVRQAAASALITVDCLDLGGEALATARQVTGGDTIAVQLRQSGEFFIRVRVADAAEPAPYELGLSCSAACDREYTRYPVVLLHGMGFGRIAKTVDYFFGVREYLKRRGYLVFAPETDAFRPTKGRAEITWRALNDLVAEGYGRRFNIIAHSQGGLDARYIASRLDRERRIASIVEISTPNRGSPVADALTGEGGRKGLPGAFGSVGGLITQLIGGAGDEGMTGALAFLTTPSMAEFNAAVPDVPGVYYASYAGRTCGYVEWACQRELGGEVVAGYLWLPYAVTEELAGDNDGLVPVASAIWGDFRGILPADHLDEVGQVFDLGDSTFAHRPFYLEEVRRLGRRGL
jgi:triacylglycerol esterase/lipase EstA (alpha/beta hydrolase family)